MIVAGIDPGKQGALVALRPNGQASVLRMPLKEDGVSIDGVAVASWLLVEDVERVAIELIGARSVKDSSGKAIRNSGREFRFAIGVGVLHGVLDTMGLPYRKVLPAKWQARLTSSYGSGKSAAIAYCQDRLPQVDLKPGRCRAPQDGIADAACLAVYARDHITWRD